MFAMTAGTEIRSSDSTERSLSTTETDTTAGVETTSASMPRHQPRKVQDLLSHSGRHVDEEKLRGAPHRDRQKLQDGVRHLGAPQKQGRVLR